MTSDTNPRVGVGVILIKDNKVLLGKRKSAHHSPGVWQFAGGHLEFGESLEDCAIRELKEETNLDIKNVRFVALTNDIYSEENKHYITIFMQGEYAGGEVKVMEPEKAERWDWYKWDEMPKPLFLPIVHLLEQGYNPFENHENK